MSEYKDPYDSLEQQLKLVHLHTQQLRKLQLRNEELSKLYERSIKRNKFWCRYYQIAIIVYLVFALISMINHHYPHH